MYNRCIKNPDSDSYYPSYSSDVIKLQLVEAGLVECLLEIVQKTVDSDKEDDIAELKTASDLMVLLLLGGEYSVSLPSAKQQQILVMPFVCWILLFIDFLNNTEDLLPVS